MNLHIIVSTPHSAPVALGLVQAATRAGMEWSIFFTHDGVCSLRDQQLTAKLANADSAIACQESWTRYMSNTPCPVVSGSQTNNSALVSKATRIISL